MNFELAVVGAPDAHVFRFDDLDPDTPAGLVAAYVTSARHAGVSHPGGVTLIADGGRATQEISPSTTDAAGVVFAPLVSKAASETAARVQRADADAAQTHRSLWETTGIHGPSPRRQEHLRRAAEAVPLPVGWLYLHGTQQRAVVAFGGTDFTVAEEGLVLWRSGDLLRALHPQTGLSPAEGELCPADAVGRAVGNPLTHDAPLFPFVAGSGVARLLLRRREGTQPLTVCVAELPTLRATAKAGGAETFRRVATTGGILPDDCVALQVGTLPHGATAGDLHDAVEAALGRPIEGILDVLETQRTRRVALHADETEAAAVTNDGPAAVIAVAQPQQPQAPQQAQPAQQPQPSQRRASVDRPPPRPTKIVHAAPASIPRSDSMPRTPPKSPPAEQPRWTAPAALPMRPSAPRSEEHSVGSTRVSSPGPAPQAPFPSSAVVPPLAARALASSAGPTSPTSPSSPPLLSPPAAGGVRLVAAAVSVDDRGPAMDADHRDANLPLRTPGTLLVRVALPDRVVDLPFRFGLGATVSAMVEHLVCLGAVPGEAVVSVTHADAPVRPDTRLAALVEPLPEGAVSALLPVKVTW